MHHFQLEPRRGRSAVERVCIGIDSLGHRIGGGRNRMRRLKHLPGIARMKERVVVAEPVAERRNHFQRPVRRHAQRHVDLERRPLPLPLGDESLSFDDQIDSRIVISLAHFALSIAFCGCRQPARSFGLSR